MDPGFLARLERQARAKHGLPPITHDSDIPMHPPPSSQSNQSDHTLPQLQSGGHEPEGEDEGDDEEDDDDPDDEDGDDDEDEELRRIGEVTEEVDEQNQLLAPHSLPNNIDSDQAPLAPPIEEPEDEDDEGTTDSDEDARPKKPEPIPTIRLQLSLPTKVPLTTVQQSVSLLAKQAGYTLPADSAITFGASSLPEPEAQPSIQDSVDNLPPPKRRRRKKIQERDEGYDKDDPFVDDSEAFIMEPKFYYPPARDGFFVASGRLELKSDLKKSKTRKAPANKAPKKASSGPMNPQRDENDIPKSKKRTNLDTIVELSTPVVTSPSQSKTALTNHQSTSRPSSADNPVFEPSNGLSNLNPPSHPTSNAIKSHTNEGQITQNQSTPRRGSPSHIAHPYPSLPSNAGPSQFHPGTPFHPISLVDEEDRASQFQPSSSKGQSAPVIASMPGTSSESNQLVRPSYLKARSLPERKSAGPLAPALEEALSRLKIEIEAASPFVPKKFPPQLKVPTLSIAQMALDLNEYDECFFIRLASLFPYNTFTIKKFVKREILPKRKAYYEAEINERIARLKQMIIEGMPAARAEYQQATREYEQALREYNAKQDSHQNGEEPPTALPANASTILGDTVMNNPLDPFHQNSLDATQSTERMPKAPQKSFKLIRPIGELLYELLKLEDELCETVKDTQKIVEKNVTLKDTSNRRQFYLRLARLWPDDFMTTNRLSREVASMKKKLEGNLVEPQNLITLQ